MLSSSPLQRRYDVCRPPTVVVSFMNLPEFWRILASSGYPNIGMSIIYYTVVNKSRSPITSFTKRDFARFFGKKHWLFEGFLRHYVILWKKFNRIRYLNISLVLDNVIFEHSIWDIIMIQFLHYKIHHLSSSFLVKIIISKTKNHNFLSNLVPFMII